MTIKIQQPSSTSKIASIPSGLKTHLAWTFTGLMPGTFKRNRPEQAHLDFPILLPLPVLKGQTEPMEGGNLRGPFIYFVLDGNDRLCYIGKSKEERLFKRWVRPGNGGPMTHYWTHSTQKGGNVFNIADGLRRGEGPFSLRFATLSSLISGYGSKYAKVPGGKILERLETSLIHELDPLWNR